MSIAKGRVAISKEELAKLFKLPEGVEIIAVRPKETTEDTFEFLVASAEETIVTKKEVPVGQQRRARVPLEDKEKLFAKGIFNTDGIAHVKNAFENKSIAKERIICKKDAEELEKATESFLKFMKDNPSILPELPDLNIDTSSITINITKQDERDIKNIFNEIVEGVKKSVGKGR